MSSVLEPFLISIIGQFRKFGKSNFTLIVFFGSFFFFYFEHRTRFTLYGAILYTVLIPSNR